jgi:outer membrane receptor protein involved in Fe transport
VDYGWQLGRDVLDGLSVRAFRQKLDHHMTVDAVMQGPMGAMTSKADATSYSTTSGGRAQLRLAPSPRLQADVGAEVNRWFADGTRWTQTASGSMPPAENTFRTWPAVSITDVGGFVQSELRISEVLTASAGARLDRVRRDADETPSSDETVLTGNAGFSAELDGGFGARASVGLGYRTPDPMELYGLALKPDGFVYRGRPDLATERGLSIEASLSWAGERASASVTGFRNRLDDMVSLRLVPDEKVAGRPVREYVTVGSALMRGLSASAESHLGMGFGVRAGLAYTRADDEDADAPLAAIPPLTLDGALRRSFAGAPLRWVEVEVQGADGQERISAAAGEKPTPGYVVLNARFGVEVGGARITAGVENLLNEEYRAHLDPVTLYRPARNVFLKASRGF